MPRTALRRASKSLLPALLALATAGGCSCGTKLKPPPKCEFTCCADVDCQNTEKAAGDPNWMNWSCSDPSTTQAHCAQGMTACTLDSDCCPGQMCNQTLMLCTDSFTMCTPGNASACGGGTTPGEQCINPLGVFPMASGCSFTTCQSNTDCAPGLSCFDNYCIGEAPCNGGCGANKVCTPVNNACFDLLDANGMPSTHFPASCQQTCTPGTILVFTNGQNVFQGCNPAAAALACSCETLPPVTSDSTALFSSSAIAGSQILVSAYDEKFGDLVLHRFIKDDPSDPKEATAGSPLWIDGIPTSGAVVGDPNGPRSGHSDPGPNVGQFTSIAFDPSTQAVHISYYDVADTNGNHTGNLKYARAVLDGSGTPGTWTIMIVDGVDSGGNKTADVGMYSNITLAPDGSPVIAYFQNPGMGSNPTQSALKVARATSGSPTTAVDWTITQVDSANVPALPCNGGCTGTNQSCGQESGSSTASCYSNSASCTTTCASDEFCGTDPSSNMAVCITTVTVTPPPEGLPAIGTGVFPSIAYPPSDWPADQRLPVVVWYNNTTPGNGTLWGATASGDNAGQGVAFNAITELDDGTQAATGLADDVGQFPSVAIGPMSVSSPVAVSYFDATSNQLMLITGGMPAWGNIAPTVVDNGGNTATSDPLLAVGADSSVQFNGSDIWIAYQDATGLSLRLAKQSAPNMPVTLDSGEGTGFYAKLLIDTSSQYVSTAVIKADTATVSGDRLVVFRVP